MKRIDNPRRNINIPDVEEWHLDGIGGLHRVGDAVLAVDPGPPQPDDGPLPTDRSASPPVHAFLIATPDVPIELGAVQQLAALGRLNTLPAAQAEAFRRQGLSDAAEDHARIGVQTLVGTPDLHRGDAGIAIGTVVGVRDGVMPLGPGPDIGCGMRVLTTDRRVGDLDLRRLGRDLRDDLFLGTRNIPLTRSQRLGLLGEGLAGLLDSEDTADVLESGDGSIWAHYDTDELEWELDHTALSGSLPGDPALFLDDYVPTTRDPITGTLGRSNHFLEIQEVAEVLDRAAAYAWDIREGMIVATIHTGSRGLGRAVGAYWRDMARAEHPNRLPRPAKDIYLLPFGPDEGTPLSGNRYLRAHGAAMNFAFANRFFLGLVVRKRLRAQHKDAGVRLLYDMPHNFVAPEWFGGERLFVHRKGAAPALGPSALVGTPYAYTGQPVIVPGSMRTDTWLLAGLDGNEATLRSAPHGAGRSAPRGTMSGMSDAEFDASLGRTLLVHPGLERPKGEAPAAYKDIGPIINAVVAAGLARPVARFRPLLTCKEG